MNAPASIFSVVIPTCHRNEALALCLDRLARGSQERMQLVTGQGEDRQARRRGLIASHGAAPENGSTLLPALGTYEVIVTDDGRATTAQEMIRERYPWVRWTAGPGRGPAANRNHGATLAAGEWLAFTDDDCLPDPGWLAAFAGSAASDETLDVIEGRTYVDRPQQHFLESSPINEQGGKMWSCNFSVRSGTFSKLGGFDEDFPYAAMEDMDFHTRLKRSGSRTAFVREAGVIHPWVRHSNWSRHFRQHLRSQLIYGQKHPEFFEEKHWFGLMLRHLKNNVLNFLPCLFRWGWESLTFAPVYWKACAQEVYVFWRRSKPESIEV